MEACSIERSRQKFNAPRLGMRNQYFVISISQFEFLEHIELTFPCVRCNRLVFSFGRMAGNQMFRTKCLKLHGVCASISCSID